MAIALFMPSTACLVIDERRGRSATHARVARRYERWHRRVRRDRYLSAFCSPQLSRNAARTFNVNGIEALFTSRKARNIRACIVYEDIELHETANRMLHCCRICHVADHGRGVAQRANIIGNGFQLFGGPAHRNDIGPRLRQSQRNRLVDPAAGTGYKRRPAFQ